MLKLNCDGDYKLLESWLQKHRDANAVIYDPESGLPVRAEYTCPLFTAYVEEPRRFFQAIRASKTTGMAE